MLATLGGLGIWYLYDLITIVGGSFRDAVRQAGHPLGSGERRRRGPPSDAVLQEVDALRSEVAELAERLDFAERLLAQPRAPRPDPLHPAQLNDLPSFLPPGASCRGGTSFAPWSASPCPVVIIQVGMMAMGVVDTIMVGHLSARALAAVALGNLYFFGLAVFGMGTLMVLDPVVAQAVGARDEPAIARGIQRGILLAGAPRAPGRPAPPRRRALHAARPPAGGGRPARRGLCRCGSLPACSRSSSSSCSGRVSSPCG